MDRSRYHKHPLEVVMHKPVIDLDFLTVIQKRFPISKEKNKFSKKRVTHIMNIGSIQKLNYLK